ncbi:hypothetical protein [Rathayibacter soli]|uniref:hypothetical protein n=1 Tax=Rathayibacter soli TaxID=3144168 RepID=UPI0027E4E48B|nr:hypothetical protein [Glaciibacter superstes]
MRSQRRTIVLAGLAGLSAVLAALAAIWPQWIEAFGFDPDHGSGALEWAIPIALAVVTAFFALAARHSWRRVRALGQPG